MDREQVEEGIKTAKKIRRVVRRLKKKIK